MDPTCGLVDKFRDLALNLIWEQLLYLVHYHRNVEQLKERLVELTLERISIEHRIVEATNNVEQIKDNVLHWLDEVQKISEQVEQLHKESQAKRECSITSCPNPWLRYKLSKRAKEMTQEVADICGKGKFDRVSDRVPPQTMPRLRNGESNEGIDSRVPIVNQLMEALRNPSVNMIGLCGPGGVGKTTIAREVEMKEKNQKIFAKVIWATVSDEFNVENIQGQIAEKLDMQLNERTEDVRAFRLYERLREEKNMLLILDDLWKELDLGKIGIRFGDVENHSQKNEGCKILLTSRNEMLLSKLMKCQKIIKVGVLSENEALELFKRIVKLSIDSNNPELISIATEIVQKCGGLPLAIATAAKALEEKDLDGWKDYLARWKNHLGRTISRITEVDASLKLSYDPLKQEYKKIFLLSAMLSHNPSIDDLLMYSIGLNILEHTENMEDARVGISTIVSKLKSLNLFLDSFSNHDVTIHDVYREVALWIASNELPAFIVRHKTLKDWPDEDKLAGYKGICLQESDISVDLPEELHGPRLEFFMLNSTKPDLTIPNKFFKSSKELKLLAFTNVHFALLPSLSFLQKLKELCLHSCVLKDITEVGSLKKLKVLSLAYSEIERLPVQLAELTYLQMLNLSHCSQLKVIPQKLLSNLKKLEVLYMENSFDQWKVEGSSEASENANLDELKDLPISSLDIHIPNVSMLREDLFSHMNLQRYRILIGKHWKWWQVNYETSKMLKLELERSIHLKSGVQKLLEKVEDLHLCGSNGHENVLYSHDGRGFPHLRYLEVESNDDIKYIVLNSARHEAAFPNLESLKLQNLNALEKLCEGSDVIVFHQLHTLKMKNLPALATDLCLKDRATNNASNKIFKSLFNNKVLLSKLEVLELSNLNSLIPLIWEDQLSPNSFGNLRTLTVNHCGFVKLLPIHVLKYLNNLEELEVIDCDMLEIVFDFEDLNNYKEMVSSSVVVPLKKLNLCDLPNLKSIWSNHYQGIVSFRCLSNVHAYGCESLTSMFPESIAKGMLYNLEELQIQNCGIDMIVAKDHVSESVDVAFEFPKLTSLKLFSLPKLVNFYPLRHTLEWSKLQRLSIEYCDKLKIFEKEVSGASEIHEEESMLNSKYLLLSHDKVIGNLEELKLQGKQAEMIGSGQFPMYHFSKVKFLSLSVKKATISYKSLRKSFPHLVELQLWGDFEEAFERDDVAALAVSFSTLTLSYISTLGSLSASLVSSPNLTHLKVTSSSYGLTTLMTSSTAQCLVHLTHLSISHCNQIEEIITKQEGEDDEDKEIIFKKLELLELEHMSRLKRFCGYNYTLRFLLLDQLIITRCPNFKIFSPGLIDTPSLKSVQLSQDWGKHHEILDTNINKTFYQQRFVASRELVLDEYDVDMIQNDQFPADTCPKVEILRTERFSDEGVRFPYTLLERFPKLNELHVENSSFEEIFPSHAHIVDQVPPFKELYLANLTVLKVSKCHQLVYLVTNSIVRSLVNLETLEIDDCKKMEEIVRKEPYEDVAGGIIFNGLRILKLTDLPRLKIEEDRRDFNNMEDRATDTRCRNTFRSLFSHNKVLLPRLEILELSNLLNNVISLIWDDQLLHNSFSNLKTLVVKSCGFLKMVPLHVLKSFNNLEKLEVSHCNMLEMVFGFEDLNDYKEMESSSVVVPLNLTHLEVTWCDELTTLMTSSSARSLVHLTYLSISYCDQIEEIITRQDGEDDEEDKEIFFYELKILELDNLRRLKRFCSHNYIFRFLMLECVSVMGCPQLTMFCSEAIHAPQLPSIEVNHYRPHKDVWMSNLNDTIQHWFTIKEVISSMKSMALNGKNTTMIMDVFPSVKTLYVESFIDEGVTFPYISLERFPNLYELYVEHSSFEEIFLSRDQIIDFIGKIPPFNELHIAYLDKLKSIWKDDSQLPPIHQDLEVLKVKSCCNLVKLAPSSASFDNLRELSVSRCHQLIHLMTTSTVKSLVSLKWLKINDCEKMEEIVMNDTNEDVESGITFNQLYEIKLTDMPSLKMFSSQSHNFKFPTLKEIKLTGCPEMKMFCPGVLEMPKLCEVKIEEHDMEWKDKGDFNKTIQMLSSAKDSVNI